MKIVDTGEFIRVVPNDFYSVSSLDLITPTPTITGLFRGDSLIPEAMNLAYERVGDTPMTILSAGCSFGCEADTIMALHNKSGSDQPLVVTGVDVNPIAVATAQAGSYRTEWTTGGLEIDQRTLSNFGFIWKVLKGDGWETALEIDCSKVREPHRVSFIEADLREKPETPKANLILLAAVLMHSPLETIADMAQSVAGMASDECVVSLGRLGRMLLQQTEVRDILIEQFGFEPVLDQAGELEEILVR